MPRREEAEVVGAKPDPTYGRTESAADRGSGVITAKAEILQDLPFLEYVACCLCNYPFRPLDGDQRKFWLLTCGHIVCNSDKHDHRHGVCSCCRKEGVQAFEIDEHFHPDYHKWFAEPKSHLTAGRDLIQAMLHQLSEDHLAPIKLQNGQLMSQVKALRKEVQKKDNMLQRAKGELAKMADLEEEMAALKEELAASKAEAVKTTVLEETVATLREQVASLRQARSDDVDSLNSTPQRPVQPLMASIRFPVNAQHSSPDVFSSQAVLGKRPRMNQDGYSPGTSPLSSNGSTTRQTVFGQRLTVPLPETTGPLPRPQSAASTRTARPSQPVGPAPRTNLYKYMFDPSSAPTHRPGSVVPYDHLGVAVTPRSQRGGFADTAPQGSLDPIPEETYGDESYQTTMHQRARYQ